MWSITDRNILDNLLSGYKPKFDDLTSKLLSDECDTENSTHNLSNLMYEFSFNLHGYTFPCKKKQKHVGAPWFDAQCRHLKSKFHYAKRLYKSYATDAHRDYFFKQRKLYISYKPQAKNKYYANKKAKLSDLSENNPRGFWNYINKIKRCGKSTYDNFDTQEFVDFFKEIYRGDKR